MLPIIPSGRRRRGEVGAVRGEAKEPAPRAADLASTDTTGTSHRVRWVMRKSLVIAVLLGAWPAAAQEPAAPPAPRYGVLPAPEAYPQRTPREALLSAARAIE